MDAYSIPLAKPSITQDDIDAVTAVLRSGRLSIGPVVEQFESELAKVAGVKYAVCVNSGTSALELIVKALGIGEGDEVICPSFTFIASANCIVNAGATPVFVDIDPHTYCLDPKKIEADITNDTKAILAVDLFGRCANWTEIEQIAKHYELLVIEDACEAIGALHHGREAGSFGDAACFSFYPNKQITTGEGGVILTNNEQVRYQSVILRNQGRCGPEWLSHHYVGHNYRMTEMQAALGLSQLRRLNELIALRYDVMSLYNTILMNCADLILPIASNEMSPFVYVVQLSQQYDRKERDRIIEAMALRGIECRAYFPPIHRQPAYLTQSFFDDVHLPHTDSIADRTIALPFYPDLTDEEIGTVCLALQELL